MVNRTRLAVSMAMAQATQHSVDVGALGPGEQTVTRRLSA